MAPMTNKQLYPEGSLSSNALCIDFDGTIVEHRFPEIGEEMPGAFETLKELKAAGYRLILWTCREDEYLTAAILYCRKKGIVFDAINRTISDEEFREDWARKPYCHTFIDDKNLGGFPGWSIVKTMLLSPGGE